MIEQIKGEILAINDQYIVVLVGGLGIGISTTPQIAASAEIGEQIHLFTDLVLRETDISMYGFADKQDKKMFRELIKVNGIGPKAALAILSNMTAGQIRNAVNRKDYAQFSRVPGIGNKTSQKIILYLQDVLDLSGELGAAAEFSSVNTELMEALVGLGYSVVEAQACIQKIPDDIPDDIESKLRFALQYFS